MPRAPHWRCCASSAARRRADMAEEKNKATKAQEKGQEKKANRRGAARLAAVQALYQMDIAGAGINGVFAEFESHWIGNAVEGRKIFAAESRFLPRCRLRRGARPGESRSPDRRCAGQGLAAEADRRHPARG